MVSEEPRADLQALARTFMRVGLTSFGGGVAMIAQVRRVVVDQHRWLTEGEFLDAVSLGQSLPGAHVANAISYIGLKMAGVRGAVVSLASFVLPSFLIMLGLTIAHDHLLEIPDAQRIFQGFNAAVVGLIVATTVRLGKSAMQQHWHLELGVGAAFLLIFTQTTVVEVVLLAGITGFIIRTWKSRLRNRVREQLKRERRSLSRSQKAEQEARRQAAELIEKGDRLSGEYQLEGAARKKNRGTEPTKRGDEGQRLNSVAGLVLLPLLLLVAWPIITRLVTVWKLATVFLRVGTVTFGGGFVMIPQIEMDVCEVYRWMDHRTFADGMAFGQITPGPVLITATFIGYKVSGLTGAVVATVAAFLPSFVMTMIAGSSIDRFRTNFQVQAFLSGVAPAVVGMLAAAAVSLAKSGLGSPGSYAVATLACLLMLRARLNPVIIIFLCGLLHMGISRGIISWLGLGL
ncbi:MAG: chromate transporter [Acidobacteriota bacterium]